MGFTTVDTKDGSRGRISAKEAADNMTEKELESDAYMGEDPGYGESKSGKDSKRLGSSREKARAADARRKDKSMDEIDDDELDSITNKMIFGSKNSK